MQHIDALTEIYLWGTYQSSHIRKSGHWEYKYVKNLLYEVKWERQLSSLKLVRKLLHISITCLQLFAENGNTVCTSAISLCYRIMLVYIS